MVTRSRLVQSGLEEEIHALIKDAIYKISSLIDQPTVVGMTDKTYTSEEQFPYLTLEGEERFKDLLIEFVSELKRVEQDSLEQFMAMLKANTATIIKS
jgi:hypothetical protein